ALEAYQDVYHRWRDAERSLAERTGRARELAREADLLRHGLDEIDSVDPKPGEEAELDALIRRLTDSEDPRDVAGEAHGAPAGDGDPALDPIATRMEQAVAALGDAATELGLYLAELPEDMAELDSAQERRHDLRALTRKYGTDIDDVLGWAQQARARLSEVDTS